MTSRIPSPHAPSRRSVLPDGIPAHSALFRIRRAGLLPASAMLLLVGMTLLTAAPRAVAQEATRTVSERFTMDTPSPSVQITNQFGRVTVNGGEGTSVVVRVDISVGDASTEEAKRIASAIDVRVEGTKNSVMVATNFDQISRKGKSGKRSMTVNVTVTAPLRSALVVKNRFGATAIADITGSVQCETSFGNTDISRCADVTVRNEFGNATLTSIRRTLRAVCKNGKLRAWDVAGGEFENHFGSIEIGKSSAPVRVESKMGSVDARAITGGSFECSYGNVDIELAKSFSGTIDAEANFGDIDSNIDLVDHSKSKDGYGPKPERRTGRIGSGSDVLRVRSSFGDIDIRAGR